MKYKIERTYVLRDSFNRYVDEDHETIQTGFSSRKEANAKCLTGKSKNNDGTYTSWYDQPMCE